MTLADPVVEQPEPASPPATVDFWSYFTAWRYIGLYLLSLLLANALFNALIFHRPWNIVVYGWSGFFLGQFLIGEIILLNRMIRRGDREVFRRPWFHVCFVSSLATFALAGYFGP